MWVFPRVRTRGRQLRHLGCNISGGIHSQGCTNANPVLTWSQLWVPPCILHSRYFDYPALVPGLVLPIRLGTFQEQTTGSYSSIYPQWPAQGWAQSPNLVEQNTSDTSLFRQRKEVGEPGDFGPCWGREREKANLIDFIHLGLGHETVSHQVVLPLASGRFGASPTSLVSLCQFLSLLNWRYFPRYHFCPLLSSFYYPLSGLVHSHSFS